MLFIHSALLLNCYPYFHSYLKPIIILIINFFIALDTALPRDFIGKKNFALQRLYRVEW